MRYTLSTALAAALLLAGTSSRAATAAESETESPEDRAEMAVWRVSQATPGQLTADEVRFLLEYEEYKNTRRAGFGLFGSGFGLALVGIALTVVDPYGPLGLAGFITVGGGVVIQSSGMFVLGLSRRAWQERLRGEFEPVLKYASARKVLVGYSRAF